MKPSEGAFCGCWDCLAQSHFIRPCNTCLRFHVVCCLETCMDGLLLRCLYPWVIPILASNDPAAVSIMANSDPSSRTSRILKMVSLPELRNVGKKAIRSLTISPPLPIPHTTHYQYCHDQHCSCRSHTRIRYARDIAALDYPDLFPEEVTLLTQILCYARPKTPPSNLPIGSTWTTQVYLEKISPLIDKLPSGLKAKVPWLHSSLCPDHKKMSIMPLRSIFHAFRFELENRLFATWLHYAHDPDTKLSPRLKAALTTVADVVGLWTEPAVFRKNFKRDPTFEHRYQERQCLACILSVIGSNPTTCLLLGAMILGSFTRPMKSVRVAWCEGWLAASFGVREIERWIRDMHGLGDALREERQRRNTERRARIAETEMQVGEIDKIGGMNRKQQDDSVRPAGSTVVNHFGQARLMVVNSFVSPLDSDSSPKTTSATLPNPISAHTPPQDSHFNDPCILCPHKQSPTLPEVPKMPYQIKSRPLHTSKAPTTPHPSPTSSRSRSLSGETLTSKPRPPPPAPPTALKPLPTKPLPKTPLRPLPPLLIPKVVPEGYLLFRYESESGDGDMKSGLWARRAEKRILELEL